MSKDGDATHSNLISVIFCGGALSYVQRSAPSNGRWLNAHDPPLLTKELGAGILLDGNVAEISLSGDETETLPLGFLYHQMTVLDVNGDVATALIGNVWTKRTLRMMPRTAAARFGAAIGLSCNAEV